MEVSRIISEIDSQISKLQQARALLADTSTSVPALEPDRPRRGRPKGSKNHATKAAAKSTPKVEGSTAVKGKRKLSPEGRRRIAEAMKKRWADRRKQAVK